MQKLIAHSDKLVRRLSEQQTKSAYNPDMQTCQRPSGVESYPFLLLSYFASVIFAHTGGLCACTRAAVVCTCVFVRRSVAGDLIAAPDIARLSARVRRARDAGDEHELCSIMSRRSIINPAVTPRLAASFPHDSCGSHLTSHFPRKGSV